MINGELARYAPELAEQAAGRRLNKTDATDARGRRPSTARHLRGRRRASRDVRRDRRGHAAGARSTVVARRGREPRRYENRSQSRCLETAFAVLQPHHSTGNCAGTAWPAWRESPAFVRRAGAITHASDYERVVLSSLLVAAASVAGTVAVAPTSPARRRPLRAAGSASGRRAAPASTRRGHGQRDGQPPAPPTDLAAVKPEDMPTAVRMRRLEQKTQALKERAWQLKARVADAQGADARRRRRRAGGDRARERDGQLVPPDQAHRTRSTARRCSSRTDDSGETPLQDRRASTCSPARSRPATTTCRVGRDVPRPRLRRVRVPLEVHVHREAARSTFIAGEGKISKVDVPRLREGRRDTPMEKRAAIECKVTRSRPRSRPSRARTRRRRARTPLPARPRSSAPGEVTCAAALCSRWRSLLCSAPAARALPT